MYVLDVLWFKFGICWEIRWIYKRIWRNWQTRMVQVHMKAISCRFKSCYPHHDAMSHLINALSPVSTGLAPFFWFFSKITIDKMYYNTLFFFWTFPSRVKPPNCVFFSFRALIWNLFWKISPLVPYYETFKIKFELKCPRMKPWRFSTK